MSLIHEGLNVWSLVYDGLVKQEVSIFEQII